MKKNKLTTKRKGKRKNRKNRKSRKGRSKQTPLKKRKEKGGGKW
jgi:hypothetical protein